MRPSLVLLAGPTGAGKSTLYETRVAPRPMLLFAAGRLVRAEPVLSDWILAGYAEDLVI